MPQNLKPLTALRFFAAMWVVTRDYWPLLGLATPLAVSRGYLAVDLFFVLSGFILSHVYLESFGTRRFRYPDFLWARLARIYPVHLATLIGLGVLIAGAAAAGLKAGDKVLVWPSLAAHLTLTQAWGFAPRGGWNHPAWSISAEWFAYLSFPLFAAVAWRLRERPRLAVALALVFLAGLSVTFETLAGFPLTRATIAWGALRIVPCFAYGCATWLMWRAGPLRSVRAACSLLACTLVGVVAAVQLGAPDWVIVSLFGPLILSLGGLGSLGAPLLTGGVWVYLGEISFAVYMVCIPWQLVFEHGVRRLVPLSDAAVPLPLWLALYLGIVPAAMVLHHLVERPAREIMRRHGVPFARRPSALKVQVSAVGA